MLKKLLMMLIIIYSGAAFAVTDSNDNLNKLIISELRPIIKKMNLLLNDQGVKFDDQGIELKYISYTSVPNCTETKTCMELTINYTSTKNCIAKFLGGENNLGIHENYKKGENIRNVFNAKLGHDCYNISTINIKKSNTKKIIESIQKVLFINNAKVCLGLSVPCTIQGTILKKPILGKKKIQLDIEVHKKTSACLCFLQSLDPSITINIPINNINKQLKKNEQIEAVYSFSDGFKITKIQF